jgi:anti-anti-sigma factor
MVVALEGEQDLSTATGVAEALAGAAALGDGDVVVDLSGVTFMDAAIIGALLDGRNGLRSQARALLVRVPSRPARSVLAMCGLMGLIDSRPQAVRDATGSCVTLRGSWSPGGSGGGPGPR